MAISLRELKPTELAGIYPLVKLLSPYVTKPMFDQRLKAMLPLGYRAVAAFDGKKMVGLSGFWIGTRFWCGRQFDIDNFVVSDAYRGKGVGQKLTAWLEKKAKAEKCDIMVLDAYVHNMMSHRFYHKMGFTITGYHFTKVPGQSARLPSKEPVLMSHKELPALPPSVTSLSVSLFGYGAALAVIAVLRRFYPDIDWLMSTILVLLAAALPPVIADLFDDHRYRDKEAGLGAKRPLDYQVLARKCLGLIVTLGTFAAFYAIFPEYQNEMYQKFWRLVEIGMPFILIAAPFYFAWCIKRQDNVHDGYDEVAALFLGHIKGRDWAEIGRHYRNWLVKAFFLPLMLSWVADAIDGLVHFDIPLNADMHYMVLHNLADRIIMFGDSLFASIGYVLTFRILNTHIRSSEPTFRGWAVALACYPPFWRGVLYGGYFDYSRGNDWTVLLADHQVLMIAWSVAILTLLSIYALATLCLGIRFSNLTYRGLVTSGPYRFTNIPAYVTKNLSWWLVAVPFIHGDVGHRIADCVMLLGVNFIYYMRARTEELHLSNYPEYIEYALAMNERSIFKPLAKALPFLKYKVPAHPADLGVGYFAVASRATRDGIENASSPTT